MANFMDKDFLLTTKSAKTLYHNYAAQMPIIDYHCHIDAAEILDDKRFKNLTEIWLGGDHYKWRLMRACGVREAYITGRASGKEKFLAFADVLPKAIGNPIYHWAHIELQRFFGITKPLSPKTAGEIWDKTSDMLKNDKTLSARGIIGRMNVETIVTTDDPVDSLKSHYELARDRSFDTEVLPAFRPDAAMNIESPGFAEYIQKLGAVSKRDINSFDDLVTSLKERIKHFKQHGCKAADHGMLKLVYAPSSEKEVGEIFKKALTGNPVTPLEVDKFKYALLTILAKEYVRLNWVMELHLGVIRDVNSPMFDNLGANTGFDCIGVRVNIPQLARVLNALNINTALPRTLIFSIAPSDNAAINTLTACFGMEGKKGAVQQGSAWWFNDSLGGMRAQLQAFAENGVLGNFIGMLTDSRSFTSYPRHEYFRRILCGYIGELADTGLYPGDFDYLGKIVQDISYNNAKEYFGLN